jgi:osmotically-inducible protein OsmY
MLALPRDLDVTVSDGVVTLYGGPISEQTSRAAIDAARHVQGVVAVRDRFR